MEEMILSRLTEIQKVMTLGAKQVLTISDVALLTGLSASWIKHLTSSREIPYYKPRGKGKIYFKKSEIEDWLLQNRQDTVSETEANAQTYLSTHK
jgi:excisionase family DNA binding protein